MDLLIPSTGLLFWMTVVFAIVFIILAKKGFPVIISMVNERKSFIDNSIRKAHEANEKLANIKLEGESILQQAREQQAAILREAAETRDVLISKAKEQAREESAHIIADAKAEIDAEKANAMGDMRRQISQLSVEIASKILRQNLSSDKQQMELIDRLLDDVPVEVKNK